MIADFVKLYDIDKPITDAEIKSAMDISKLRFKLLFSFSEYFPDEMPVGVHLLKRNTAYKEFKQKFFKLNKGKTKIIPISVLNLGLDTEINFNTVSALCIDNSKILPIRLPPFGINDKIILTVCRLVWKMKLKLLIMDFQNYASLYDESAYEKILSIPGAIYLFERKSLHDLKVKNKILELFSKRKAVFSYNNFRQNRKKLILKLPERLQKIDGRLNLLSNTFTESFLK